MRFCLSLVLLSVFLPDAWAWVSCSPTTLPQRLTTVHMSSEGEDGGELQSGRVKWFDTAKGFGFIVPDAGGPDVFVHQTAIDVEGFRSLAEDELVEYQVMKDASGRLKAMHVTGPDGSPVQGAPFRPSNDYDSF